MDKQNQGSLDRLRAWQRERARISPEKEQEWAILKARAIMENNQEALRIVRRVDEITERPLWTLIKGVLSVIILLGLMPGLLVVAWLYG